MEKLILTIDLEWYYNGDEKGEVTDFSAKSLEERFEYDRGQVEKSTDAILDLLKEHDQKITFFVVAEIDKVYPQVLKKISRGGHEIAVHSYRHDEQTSIVDFEADLKRSASFKKKYKAVGFRSPRIRIRKEFYSSLKKFGYQYDSSVYGTAQFEVEGVKVLPVSFFPFRKKSWRKTPAPLSWDLLRQGVPFGGGLAAGLLQRGERFLISRFIQRYQEPPCLFLESWQVKKPDYPWKFLWRNPFMFPYSLECEPLLEFFCQSYQFLRVRDYLL